MNMDERFDRLDASINRQMELFESRFDSPKREMHRGFVEVNERFNGVDARMDRMEVRLDKIAAGTHFVTRLSD